MSEILTWWCKIMKMSKMAGRRLREVPKDAKTVSHQFLVRGGYIRPVSAGIYSLLPVGKRIVAKIENIIREVGLPFDEANQIVENIQSQEPWKNPK